MTKSHLGVKGNGTTSLGLKSIWDFARHFTRDEPKERPEKGFTEGGGNCDSLDVKELSATTKRRCAETFTVEEMDLTERRGIKRWFKEVNLQRGLLNEEGRRHRDWFEVPFESEYTNRK